MTNVQWDEHENERSRARLEFVGKEGDYWLKKRADEIAKLPDGTVVVINIVNEFVSGASWAEAMAAFDQRFGVNTTLGYVHEIGRPVLIGAFGGTAHG
jgi:hypothetical protein